jgi:hypothetical protein
MIQENGMVSTAGAEAVSECNHHASKRPRRYLIIEVANPLRSWVRNEETGEDRPEMLWTFARTDNFERACALARECRREVEFDHPVLIWDKESPEWDKFVDVDLDVSDDEALDSDDEG